MNKYSTSYLNRFIARNTLKDKLASPMIEIIKRIIKMDAAYIKVQDKYR